MIKYKLVLIKVDDDYENKEHMRVTESFRIEENRIFEGELSPDEIVEIINLAWQIRFRNK